MWSDTSRISRRRNRLLTDSHSRPLLLFFPEILFVVARGCTVSCVPLVFVCRGSVDSDGGGEEGAAAAIHTGRWGGSGLVSSLGARSPRASVLRPLRCPPPETVPRPAPPPGNLLMPVGIPGISPRSPLTA